MQCGLSINCYYLPEKHMQYYIYSFIREFFEWIVSLNSHIKVLIDLWDHGDSDFSTRQHSCEGWTCNQDFNMSYVLTGILRFTC